MKKVFLSFTCLFFLLFSGITVEATEIPTLSVEVKGKLEAKETIQILINIDSIDSLYAASASLKYDPDILEIISFEKGDLISIKNMQVYSLGDKIDNKNGIASFGGFSCLGDTTGFKGSGTFIKINAKLLKNHSFHIKSKAYIANSNADNNLQIKLCSRNDKNIKELNYKFKAYQYKVDSEGNVEVVVSDTETQQNLNENKDINSKGNQMNNESNNEGNYQKNNEPNNEGNYQKNNEPNNEGNYQKNSQPNKKVNSIDNSLKLIFIIVGGSIVLILLVCAGIFYYKRKYA